MDTDLHDFQACRPSLLGLAYRMLGDLGRAEDVVQDAWLRWQGRTATVAVPRAFLLTTVTRLCLNELSSGRARFEESRSDRLPEPVHLPGAGLDRVEALESVSMAFLVLLQRLTPAERAVLLLHDVFELRHRDIAPLVKKSEAACRQLLTRARAAVADARRTLSVDPDVHARLLSAFADAASTGNIEALSALLTDDVLLIADAGPDGGRFGRVKNLGRPLVGARKVAAFLAAAGAQAGGDLHWVERELNGLPALLVVRGEQIQAAILLAVEESRIRGVFMQADPTRLAHLSPA
jgi:RNA polymerase sigma-70 factor (ECF subfamily)